MVVDQELTSSFHKPRQSTKRTNNGEYEIYYMAKDSERERPVALITNQNFVFPFTKISHK